MVAVVAIKVLFSLSLAHAGRQNVAWTSTYVAREISLAHRSPFRRLVDKTQKTEVFFKSSHELVLRCLRGGADVDIEETELSDENDDDPLGQENTSDNGKSDHSSPSILSSKPVSVTVKTLLRDGQESVGKGMILDQLVELNVPRSRNMLSIKQSLQKQLPGRPPIATMQLVHQGRNVQDDVMVDELLEDDDEEDDEYEEGNGNNSLVLLLDMIPPVDPKSIADQKQLDTILNEMTVSELLDAYVINEAALYQNAALLLQDEDSQIQSTGANDDDDDIDDDESISTIDSSSHDVPLATTRKMKEKAARLRQDLEAKLLSDEASKKLLAETRPPSVLTSIMLQKDEIRGNRVRPALNPDGVQSSWKRALQRNLNINWVDTLRHVCLFLFFGWFGGRTPFSRAVLLLGAPGIILIQARPVKLFIRQLWYFLLDQPPSILLSLLPAPQQAILDLDIPSAMETIYGKYAVESNFNEESIRDINIRHDQTFEDVDGSGVNDYEDADYNDDNNNDENDDNNDNIDEEDEDDEEDDEEDGNEDDEEDDDEDDEEE